MSVPLNAEIISEALEASQTISVGVFGFTLLVWDHVITFADEVEIIWGRPKTLLTFLFLLNRYLTPIGFIVNLVAYSLPSWSIIKCEHFVRYEGAMTAVGIQVVGLMMFLRVRAMYRDNRYVVILVASLLFVWVAVGAWLLSHSVAVPHSSFVHSCRMEFSDHVGDLASAWAWVPLGYDTVLFALTLYRTLPSIHNKEAGHIVHTLFINGVLFYSVMCAINLIFTIMVVRAPQGLKNITGQLELVLTVAMMSRITLSLKKEGTRSSVPFDTHLGSKFPLCFDCQRPVQDTIKPQLPTPSSQTCPIRTEQFEMRAFNSDVSSQGQRDNEDRTCFTCSAVTGAFDPADEAMV